MQTPEKVDSLFIFEAGSINTIINDNHGTIYTNRSGQEQQPEELTDDDLRNKINQVLPLMKNSRHWFCIIKVLMLHGQVLDGDFEAGKNLIERLYPAGVTLKIDPADLSKLQQQRPNLSVIRDSGQIAEAADYVLFVWRPAVNHLPYDGDFAQCDTSESALLIVGKNRQGPTLDTLVGWRPVTTLFYDLSPEQVEQIRHGQRPTLAQRAVQGVLFE